MSWLRRALRPTRLLATTLPCWLGCHTPDPAAFAPCDVRTQDCQRNVFAAVETLRGQIWYPGLSLPPVTVVSPERHRARVRSMLPDFQASPMSALWSEPLQHLGLLAPTLDVATADQQWNENTLANYWSTSKDITIVDRGTPLNDAPTVAILVHEYIHAAQDREFALGYFGPSTTDAELLRTAFIEGEADLLENLAALSMEGRSAETFDWQGSYRSRLLAVRNLVPAAASPHTEVRRSMPYALGGAFMASTWLLGGPVAVNRAYLAAPRASVQLMLASEGRPTELPAPVELCPPVLDRPRFVRAAVDTLGAAVFYAYLVRFAAQEEDAWQSALTWQGDRIWLFRVPGNQTISLWRVHAPGLRTSPLGATLAARDAPPVLVGDDLLDWSTEDPEAITSLHRSLSCGAP